jgi:hypothetical protein
VVGDDDDDDWSDGDGDDDTDDNNHNNGGVGGGGVVAPRLVKARRLALPPWAALTVGSSIALATFICVLFCVAL